MTPPSPSCLPVAAYAWQRRRHGPEPAAITLIALASAAGPDGVVPREAAQPHTLALATALPCQVVEGALRWLAEAGAVGLTADGGSLRLAEAVTRDGLIRRRGRPATRPEGVAR